MAKTIQQYETTMILNTKIGEDGINALVEKFKTSSVRTVQSTMWTFGKTQTCL